MNGLSVTMYIHYTCVFVLKSPREISAVNVCVSYYNEHSPISVCLIIMNTAIFA